MNTAQFGVDADVRSRKNNADFKYSRRLSTTPNRTQHPAARYPERMENGSKNPNSQGPFVGNPRFSHSRQTTPNIDKESQRKSSVSERIDKLLEESRAVRRGRITPRMERKREELQWRP
jgi:hypothetical protein